jgi:hypothetical protein
MVPAGCCAFNRWREIVPSRGRASTRCAVRDLNDRKGFARAGAPEIQSAGEEASSRPKRQGRPRAPFGIETAIALASVLLAELVDAAARVNDLLLARIERVAVGTDFYLEIVTECGTR